MQTNKQTNTQQHQNLYLKPLYDLTDDEIYKLSLITNDINVLIKSIYINLLM